MCSGFAWLPKCEAMTCLMLGRRLDWDPEQRAQKKEGRLQGLRQSRFLLRKEAQCAQDWDVLWFVGYIKENPGNSSIIRTVYLLRGVKTKQREPSLSSFLSFRWIWFRDQGRSLPSSRFHFFFRREYSNSAIFLCLAHYSSSISKFARKQIVESNKQFLFVIAVSFVYNFHIISIVTFG